MKIKTKVIDNPVIDRSRNRRYDGWTVKITLNDVVLFEKNYHSTSCNERYAGYDAKAFNKGDAKRQTELAFAERTRQVYL